MKNTPANTTKNKAWQYISPILFWRIGGILVLCLLISCREEEKNGLPETLKNVVLSGDLLVDVFTGDDVRLYFENDTVILSHDEVDKIEMDRKNWNTNLVSNGISVNIPTLGESFNMTHTDLQLNPTGYAPLSALLTFSVPVPSRIQVRVKGKTTDADITHVFRKYGYNHKLEIHGLYINYDNRVYISITDKEGKVRMTDSLQVVTGVLPDNIVMPAIKVTTADIRAMEPGLTLVNFLGDNEFDTHRPFMIDANGDVRWILLMKSHPELYTLTAHTGLSRMKNGNFLCGDVKTGKIYELDMMGRIAGQWDIRSMGYEFHHEVMEKPNGNFLVTVTRSDSKLKSGEASIYDVVIEIDRETGKLANEWDLKKTMDETRSVLNPEFEPSNWAHNNAVAYSEADNSIIVSNRYQGLVKLDNNNRLKWILTPHRDCSSSMVLQPRDASGNDPGNEVKNGYAASDGFDWVWGGHCPQILPDGSILVFDNGFYRNYVENDLYANSGYSRSVIYKIDEEKNTVQQVWEYGKERGREAFAVAVSSTQYLPNTGNILHAPGVGTRNINGIGGKIVEVDFRTKEVIFEAHISTYTYFGFHRVTRMNLYPDQI